MTLWLCDLIGVGLGGILIAAVSFWRYQKHPGLWSYRTADCDAAVNCPRGTQRADSEVRIEATPTPSSCT